MLAHKTSLKNIQEGRKYIDHLFPQPQWTSAQEEKWKNYKHMKTKQHDIKKPVGH